jgi:hypothetical protein
MNKKIEFPVEAIEESRGEVQPKAVTEPLILMTLEEKVIDYINKHPNGVKILDMEEPLGERRMKIGFVTENLFNEGKVQRRENNYFPVKSQ